MDSTWRRAETLFHAALERPPHERESWLAAQDGCEPALRKEVESLLQAYQRHIELGAGEAAPEPAVREVAPWSGRRYGPYRTERVLGAGGMGTVYLARRADGQFDQTVAIKVMAPHLAGEEFLRGFRNERQLLAVLAHPHVARLLDGGITPGGEPYLVMEYIDGQALDRYCADRRLPVGARIRLFLQVCAAVEFAHQNLIVHGDLKPANLLVTSGGTVKLLDFGTARLLRNPQESVTQSALLTPRYASPEQLRGDRVNTLSDVFSLGVIFYELLVGAWPFGDPASRADSMDRVLGGREAHAPVQAVSEQAAVERGVTRDRLRRLLGGDLSTVMLKMLESDPARRYASVREAREDLQRFSEGRTIQARPHTAAYAAGRFVARHWAAVSAAGLSILALTALTVFSVYQSGQARIQALRAERIGQFAKDTFLSASSYWYSPLRARHDAIQFSDILDSAAARVGREMADDPEAEADLRSTMGFTYAMLGEPAKGEEQLRLGLRLLPRIRGGAPRVAAVLYANLCDACSFQGRYAEALAACRQAVSLDRELHHPMLGPVLHDSAYMAANAGEPLAEAERLYLEARRFPPPNPPQYQSINDSRLGMLRLRQGDLEGGERLLRPAEAALRGNGEPLIEIVPVLYARAFGAEVRGRYADAVRLMSEALDLVTRRNTAFMSPDERALQLAAYEALDGRSQALARLRAVEQRLSYDSVAAADRIQHHLFAGMVEARCGSASAAERHLRSVLAIQEKEMSRQPDLRVEACVRLMELLQSQGREQDAREVARDGLRAATLAYGSYFAGHPFVARMQNRLR